VLPRKPQARGCRARLRLAAKRQTPSRLHDGAKQTWRLHP
jgi:hypothetical protein